MKTLLTLLVIALPLSLNARNVQLSNAMPDPLLVRFLDSGYNALQVIIQPGDNYVGEVLDSATTVVAWRITQYPGPPAATSYESIAGAPFTLSADSYPVIMLFDLNGATSTKAYILDNGYLSPEWNQHEIFWKAFALGVVVGLGMYVISIMMKVGEALD